MSRIIKRIMRGVVRGAKNSMYINLTGEMKKTKIARTNNITQSWENVGTAISKRLQNAN